MQHEVNATKPDARTKLIAVLSAGLGPEVATKLVTDTTTALGFGDELGRREILRVLDRLVEHPGLVGVSARFTKSQVMLWTDFPNRPSAPTAR